jgi:SAM-dependent methyltransferase
MSADVDLDQVNLKAWRSADAVGQFRRHGWIDPGERAAIDSVAGEAKDAPILDIGVGIGRTVPLLADVSGDYVGIDYTEKLVALCRAAYPGRRILHMDARDLSAFADGTFGLVVFSYNGIDAVPYEDRLKILREVNRVLRPGGLFVVSAHNRDGPGFDERPLSWFHWTINPVRLGWRILGAIRSVPGIWNYWRHRRLHRDGDGWAIRTAAAHDFGIVIIYTTLQEQKRQLAAAGFRTEAVFDNESGKPVADDSDTRDVWWFHFVARKVAA